jgi:hypothetical protein
MSSARRWRPRPSILPSSRRSPGRSGRSSGCSRQRAPRARCAPTLDLRLLFAATRAAGQLQDGAWRRMLELGIDALRPPGVDQASAAHTASV